MSGHLIKQIEGHAFSAWPAAAEEAAAGWILRASGGFSRRLNSVQPDSSTDDLEARLSGAEAYYSKLGLPLIVRVTPSCLAVDPLLADLGFTREAPTDVLITDIVAGSDSPSTEVMAAPTGSWLEAQADWLVITDREPWEDILRRAAAAGRAGFGLLLDGNAPVAAGLAVRRDDWVGLFEITVDPVRRGRGFGRAITQDLMAWGESAGAPRSYLQVPQSALVARKLYDSLGFTCLYTYWYRRAPTTGWGERHAPHPESTA